MMNRTPLRSRYLSYRNILPLSSANGSGINNVPETVTLSPTETSALRDVTARTLVDSPAFVTRICMRWLVSRTSGPLTTMPSYDTRWRISFANVFGNGVSITAALTIPSATKIKNTAASPIRELGDSFSNGASEYTDSNFVARSE